MNVDYAVFDNIECEIKTHLLSANEIVEIAVAWISVDNYFEIFKTILSRGIILNLIVSDEEQLKKYNPVLNQLLNFRNFNLYKVKVNNINRMHHKFCIIDSKILINGSYNWTKNANYNKENIIVSYNLELIHQYRNEIQNIYAFESRITYDKLKEIAINMKYCSECEGKRLIKGLILKGEDKYGLDDLAIMEYCTVCKSVGNISFLNVVSALSMEIESIMYSDYYDDGFREEQIEKLLKCRGIQDKIHFICKKSYIPDPYYSQNGEGKYKYIVIWENPYLYEEIEKEFNEDDFLFF